MFYDLLRHSELVSESNLDADPPAGGQHNEELIC